MLKFDDSQLRFRDYINAVRKANRANEVVEGNQSALGEHRGWNDLRISRSVEADEATTVSGSPRLVAYHRKHAFGCQACADF